MIGMYDSGVGGLSIWRAVVAQLPLWPITYLADQAYCPYGKLSQNEITARTLRIGHYLVELGATLLVVACNTATSNAIQVLRRSTHVPVVGVEPAIKPAAQASNCGRIGVVATRATLESVGFRSLIQRFASHTTVFAREGSGWVEQVERGDLTSAYTQGVVSRVITPLSEEGVDHIVLGCTHYPFLLPVIKATLADSYVIVTDPALAVARRINQLLQDHSPAHCDKRYQFLTTSNTTEYMEKLLPVLIDAPYPITTVPL